MIGKLYLAILIAIISLLLTRKRFVPEDFTVVQQLDPNEPEAIGWRRTTSRNTLDYLYVRDSSAIRPVDFCTDEPVLLHIFVISAADRFLHRETIRHSWGNIDAFNYDKFKQMHYHAQGTYLNINRVDWRNFIYNEDDLIEDTPADAKFRIKVTFIIGDYSKMNADVAKIVDTELQTHDDIIVEDFTDHYANMTLKTLAMLKWATSVCKNNAEFIAKVDDDTFVLVPNLIHVLLGGTLPLYEELKYFYDHKTIKVTDDMNRMPAKGLLAGHIWYLAIPNRNPSHKYYTPHYLYNRMFYPSYLAGFMYFMSIDVAKKLYKGAQTMPLFHMEDIYFTGMVAKKANITLTRSHLQAISPVETFCQFRGIIAEQGRNIIERVVVMQKFQHQLLEQCDLMSESWVKYLYKLCYLSFEPWLSLGKNYFQMLSISTASNT